MKKTIFFLFFVLTSYIVSAQAFGGGFFAGLSASQLDGDRSSGYHKAGLAFGIYTNAKLNKHVDAQMELKYIQKGSKWESEDQMVFYQSKLNYIELPIFLKYHFLERFSANLGIAAGYLQKATENKDRIGDEPADPPFDPFELSGLAGVEYQIIENLYFNVRFNYSILAIRSHPGDQSFFLNRGQYNNVLTFAVYYQLANANKNEKKKACDCNNRRKWFGLR